MSGIGGQWALHGTALNPDGTPIYEWEADLTIEDRATGPRMVMTTKGGKSSRSVSYAERLVALPSGEWALRYGYEADPEHEATASHAFFGLVQLTFAADLQTAAGSGCNFNGRYVVMRLALTRA